MNRNLALGLLFALVLILPAVSAQGVFIRGDANSDGKVDISDTTFINNYLFSSGAAPKCLDAADADDNGKIEITDSVYLNNYLFLGSGKAPPAPYPVAGVDTTEDILSCDEQGEGAMCQAEACDPGIRESAEGPGEEKCACTGNREDAGYEECFGYFTKSTATIPKFLGLAGWLPEKSDTDSCIDRETLKEVAIDCQVWDQDDFVYREIKCNDLNEYGDWFYYCENGMVLKERTHYDYYCSDGSCDRADKTTDGPYWISKQGDDAYCADKLKYSTPDNGCNGGCTQGEYDCDSNGECSAGLVCKEDFNIFTSDGCCTNAQTWDGGLKKCLDCEIGSGPCCDANGAFESDSKVCDSNMGIVYACEGNCLGNDVLRKTKKQVCSGSSSSCNGEIVYGNPSNPIDCSSSQFCKGSTSWSATQKTCADAQCTSGTCCDTTCGVFTYKSSSTSCGTKSEEGCPWGINPGNDAGKRDGGQKCSGNSADCSGQINWNDWVSKENCDSEEYCYLNEGVSSCKYVACFRDSDCGPDGFDGDPFCKDGNAYDFWNIRTCINAGTKDARCTKVQEERLREICDNELVWNNIFFCKNGDVYEKGYRMVYSCIGSSCGKTDTVEIDRITQDCGDNVCETVSSTTARCKDVPPVATCSDGIKNQDETDKDCGGTKCEKCANTKICSGDSDCQSGFCNLNTKKCEVKPTCTNACVTSGATSCSSLTKQQTCGNYDADVCLEWGGEITCANGCSNDKCNTDGKADLTITNLVVQYPSQPLKDQMITMAFSIKNIGTKTASNIGWKLDQGTTAYFPRTGSGISLDAGKSITVFTKITYNTAGTYNVNVIVDPTKIIPEVSEDNNELTRVVKVI